VSERQGRQARIVVELLVPVSFSRLFSFWIWKRGPPPSWVVGSWRWCMEWSERAACREAAEWARFVNGLPVLTATG
jgi:hypothetical protein